MVMVNIDDQLYEDLQKHVDGVKIQNIRHFVNLAIIEKIQNSNR